MIERISLEKAALDFAKANEAHPRIYELPVDQGRKLFDTVQDSPVFKYNVDIEDELFDTGEYGIINIRIVRPAGNYAKLPVIMYTHGAGWVFGDSHTHDKLIRELSVRTNSVVVFPEYNRSPEVRYSVAIEQLYSVLKFISNEHTKWDGNNLIVAGDSVGGNMTTVMTILAKKHKGPKILGQVLYYPVTDANFETKSYNEFADHYFLTKEGMQWFWDQYTIDPEQRKEITASPLRATKEQLQGLPAAIILNGEADVLRDEGEAYARKLREAGVDVTAVRFQGMVHDFVMVNSLDQSKATRAAMTLSTDWIMKKQKR